MKDSTLHLRESFVIQRPTLHAVVDTFRELFHLPPRHQQGFISHGERTLVETIIDEEGSGLGPITISTNNARLFVYAAKYDDECMALMTVVGHSVSATFRNGATPHAVGSVMRATNRHGPIVSHTLLNVVTPATVNDSAEAFAVLQARTHLHQLIFDAGSFESASIPPLSLSKVILRGWPEHGSQLPSCTFQTMVGDQLWMRLAWGQTYQESDLFRLL